MPYLEVQTQGRKVSVLVEQRDKTPIGHAIYRQVCKTTAYGVYVVRCFESLRCIDDKAQIRIAAFLRIDVSRGADPVLNLPVGSAGAASRAPGTPIRTVPRPPQTVFYLIRSGCIRNPRKLMHRFGHRAKLCAALTQTCCIVYKLCDVRYGDREAGGCAGNIRERGGEEPQIYLLANLPEP